MGLLVILVIAGTAIWVVADTSNLRVRSGSLGGGFFDMGPLGWFLCVLVVWIVGFPAYLVMRPKYVALAESSRPPANGAAIPQQQTPPPFAPTHSQSPLGGLPTVPPPLGRSDDKLARIERLVALHTSGALSDEEFARMKSEVLAE